MAQPYLEVLGVPKIQLEVYLQPTCKPLKYPNRNSDNNNNNPGDQTNPKIRDKPATLG